MSESSIESFGLRRSAAVATGLYVLTIVAAIAYLASLGSLDLLLLIAAAFAILVTAPACYVLLLKQWRELGLEPTGGS